MKTKNRIPEDPVVAEVRAIRAKLWQEGGGTIEGFLRLLQGEAKGGRRRVARSTEMRSVHENKRQAR